MKTVYIAVPSYSGTMCVETVQALCYELPLMQQNGMNAVLRIIPGGGNIIYMRNRFAADFLRRIECSELLFIDDDVAWQPGELLGMLKKDYNVVAGVYPRKSDPLDFPYRPLREGTTATDDGLIEVEAVPAGFMKISRACLERMVREYKDLEYDDDYIDCPAYDLFGHFRIGRRIFSEDFSFCHLWRQIGGKVMVDPALNLSHVGRKVYSGALIKTLRIDENVIPMRATQGG